MTVYIEFLSLRSFFADILSELINKRYYDDKTSIFYFIDANKLGVLVANLFSKFLGCKFNRLDFKHIDIKDEKGDLISLRIGRKDIHPSTIF